LLRNSGSKKGADLMLPVNLNQLPDDALARDIRQLHNDNGLAGGFHYGFESAAIYHEFWRDRISTSAELEDPAFSSVGGWGRQTVRFSNDKTVIKSVTTMGRTHVYAVERIGRIGVFWHKAKHVIDYERTVIPSRQFPNQPDHHGRPLVRKLREFIEILEPERRYPDFVHSEVDAPGAVLACHFQSKRIPVLSSWGADIKKGSELIGWEVPLWKEGADISIYPKPQIQLELTPPPDLDKSSLRVNLSGPENLYFYTDTRSEVGGIKITARNVHQWPRVKYVDYTVLPEPEPYNVDPHFDDDPDYIDYPLPDALDVFPGFERFTFRVDPHEIPAAVANRYYPTSALTGRMRTVSMQRGGGRNEMPSTELDNPITNAKKAYKLLSDKNGLLKDFANGFSEADKRVLAGSKVSNL